MSKTEKTRFELIELTEEQPTEPDFYFVIGKGDYKAVLWWNGTEFERDNVAHNKFDKEDCKWIKIN